MSATAKRAAPGKRKPKPPKPSKLCTAADVLPATELRQIRSRLDLACSTAIVVEYGLREQNVMLDDDAANVLRRHVSDVLFVQIQSINRLLGEDDEGDEDDEDEDGGTL